VLYKFICLLTFYVTSLTISLHSRLWPAANSSKTGQPQCVQSTVMTTADWELQHQVTLFFTRCVLTCLLTYLLTACYCDTSCTFCLHFNFYVQNWDCAYSNLSSIYTIKQDYRRNKICHWSKLPVIVRADRWLWAGWQRRGQRAAFGLFYWILENFTNCFCGFLILVSFFGHVN